ncbi:MAG: cytochrome c [Dokdonella sp.]|uniref:c-type cytochrome n=1 Tax=Dokdonella sp. TaxID=2291710 RepID=UPI0025C105F1|nr:cytochrome c [Dokdonella sp.]MBX3700820.1 cytochrome c [Dokdonella sp.]MCW5577616.1 cytochrome c [Dokdonella sp.]
MTRIFASLAISTLAVLATPALAKGDLDAGKAKAIACQACHGTDGNAGIDPQYPRLAGQYRDYLARALHEYRSGKRTNPIMAGFAGPLSDQEIDDLAAYFSSLPGKLSTLHGHVQGQ